MKMYDKLQLVYNMMSVFLPENTLKDMNLDQAGGPGVSDSELSDLNLIEISNLHKLADTILLNLNILAGRNVIIQH